MIHRHLNAHDGWTRPKIDDILDRGGFEDWKALARAMEGDREVAGDVLAIARAVVRYGTSAFWARLVLRVHPELADD